MFDKKNDYVINRFDAEAIVCRSVTGAYIRLTRENFSSEEEFQRWKTWSDRDYQQTEKTGRSFYDKEIPWEEHLGPLGVVSSVEEDFFARLTEMENVQNRRKLCEEQVAMVQKTLTEAQYRRLWMYCVLDMSLKQIAQVEGVSHQNISKSILSAKKKIKKIMRRL